MKQNGNATKRSTLFWESFAGFSFACLFLDFKLIHNLYLPDQTGLQFGEYSVTAFLSFFSLCLGYIAAAIYVKLSKRVSSETQTVVRILCEAAYIAGTIMTVIIKSGAAGGEELLCCAVFVGQFSGACMLTLWTSMLARVDRLSMKRILCWQIFFVAIILPTFYLPFDIRFFVYLVLPLTCVTGFRICSLKLAPSPVEHQEHETNRNKTISIARLAIGIGLTWVGIGLGRTLSTTEYGLDAFAAILVLGEVFALIGIALFMATPRFKIGYLFELVVFLVAIGLMATQLPLSSSSFLCGAFTATASTISQTAVMVLAILLADRKGMPTSLTCASFYACVTGGLSLGVACMALLNALGVNSRSIYFAVVIPLVSMGIFAAALWLLNAKTLESLLYSEKTEDGFASSVSPEYCAAIGLTQRESEILELLLQGKTAATIAAQLSISQNTANTHIKHIYQKAGAHSRHDLANTVGSQSKKTSIG